MSSSTINNNNNNNNNTLSSSSSSSLLEIDTQDVIRLILQFCKENLLTTTMRTLQMESKVSLNTVDSIEHFISDIIHGRWDTVLQQLSFLTLPTRKIMDVYEQVIYELLEMKEYELIKEFMKQTDIFQYMKENEMDRYIRLEKMCKNRISDPLEIYNTIGINKTGRRQEIADDIRVDINVVPPSRLLTLLSQAIKFQHANGILPTTTNTATTNTTTTNMNMNDVKYDLFRGQQKTKKRDDVEKIPKRANGQIKFGVSSHVECCKFSPDGMNLVIGSVDGFIEVWDPDQCKVKKDLLYQAQDDFMMHDDAVLCMSFSRDGENLVTGSLDGKICIWKLATGQCIRRFERAHTKGITCVNFSRDGSQIISSSFDHLIRLHGRKSGKTLKDFKGHTSYVNTVCYTHDGLKIASGSSDGTVKIWDLKTTSILHSFRPEIITTGSNLQSSSSSSSSMIDTAIHTIIPMPGVYDHFLIGNRSNTVYVTTISGQIIKSMSNEKNKNGDFVCITTSPKGQLIYCVGQDGNLYSFNLNEGKLESVLKVSDDNVIGITHHPHNNLLTTYTDQGLLQFWKP